MEEDSMICQKCGALIEEGSEFCGECGTPVAVVADAPAQEVSAGFCGECGAPLRPGVLFCTECGAKVDFQPESGRGFEIYELPRDMPVRQMAQSDLVQEQVDSRFTGTTAELMKQKATGTTTTAVQQAGKQYVTQVAYAAKDFFTGDASDLPGEMDVGSFGDTISNITDMTRQGAGYAKNIAGAAKGAQGVSGKAKFRIGLALLSAIALAAFWIVQLIWIRDGVENPFAKFMEWLTFAQGGVGRGVLGFVGGIIGKGTVAAALAGLVGGGFGSLISGFKGTFSGKNFQKKTLGFTLVGMGISLALYQAFTGEGTLAGAMAAVSGMLVAARSLGGRAGMIFGVVKSLTAQKTGNQKRPQNASLTATLSGLTMGFALAVPLAAIPWEWTHLILSIVLVAVGLILALLFGNSGSEPRMAGAV